MSNSFVFRISVYDVHILGREYIIHKEIPPKTILNIDLDLRLLTASFHNNIHTYLEYLL